MDGLFEKLLREHKVVVERYIHYRMPSVSDAEDVIQETYLAAFQGFGRLQQKELFKPWILSIAGNQCSLWYRKHYGRDSVPLESVADTLAVPEPEADDTVADILKRLPPEYEEILRMTMSGYRQREMADLLGIPVGTVKSRVHAAKKQFRAACPEDFRKMYERGIAMKENDCLHGFPEKMPRLTVRKKDAPFFEIKFADESFIVPVLGNRNSEGTYRYPDRKLALVSTCYVPKKAVIHEVEGVKICRDTYNVRAGKLYRNEAVWFVSLTEEYMRDLGTIRCDTEGDEDIPTYITTFLDEDYDMSVNGNDCIHGKPLLVKENPPEYRGDEIIAGAYSLRYTTGVYDVTIGSRTFETVGILLVQRCGVVTESYADRSGRLVLMRWYESAGSIRDNMNYTPEFAERVRNNPGIRVNGTDYILIEDRISEYAL